ncbi:hypothetical protein BLNAU_14713 [Blattamonas nauphoetae]|uniref:Protein kinase domain-containing protein n=1 Tax=Blattamonas nauphoetae TaxID=2049346 RepID=A0ABQ9XD12_9EUKA|nr:hypothetical protein BLNAU_14713 [Blattamonas nauphoetae]
MNFICLLSILLSISKSQHQLPSPKLLSLEAFLSQQGINEALNRNDRLSEIMLPNGRYHVLNYEIASTTMNMNGKQSALFPSSTTNDEDFSDHSKSNGFANEMKNKRNELFRILNSTIWMSELTFECGSAGSSIATICGSCVRIGGSRVISNSERTPFVIIKGESGKSSSVTIIACSHTSSCFPSLLPLTSLETSDSWMTHNQESSSLKTDMSVTGSGISVCDACLIGGSGALFDFCGLGQTVTDGSSMTTTLSSSLLLNTTSSSGSGRVGVDVDVKEGGCDSSNSESVSQKMIGSCVSLCTNHLYGTGIRDLNLGGSVLCSNTSFIHCTATVPYTNQHYSNPTNLITTGNLYHFTLCTFKGCSSSNGGGAVRLYEVKGDLKFESCSFDSCSAPSGNAGAIYFIQTTKQSSVTITSSSFKSMLDAHSGGSLFFGNMQTLSISGCVFLESKAVWYGGAANLVGWNAQNTIGFSNCLFEDCQTSLSSPAGDGGAIYFDSCSAIRLDSVSFRDCVAGNRGHDLRFLATFPTVSTTTASNCDSTSTPNTNRISPVDGKVGDPLPNPTTPTTILSLIYDPVTTTRADIVVTLDKEVKGSVLVFVSNLAGNAQPAGKAPNIGRVLLFSIDSSDTGRYTANIGETGLLQLPLEDYKLVAASLPKHFASFSEVYLRSNKNPTLTSAACVPDESRTHALLILGGSDLEDTTFTLTLHTGKTIEAGFTENEVTIDLGVIGESSGWIENEEFVIESGTKKGETIGLSVPSPLSFRIPEAARLTNIEVSELNPAKTEVTLSFSSRLLKANQDYEITIEAKDGSGEVVMNLTTDNSGHLADQTVKLYPSNENVEGWKNSIGYGKEYEVVGISAKLGDTDYPTHFSLILLKMPIEPVRVKSADCSTDQPTTTVVSVEGSGFIEHETYTLTLSGKPASNPDSLDVHDTKISVVASSPTEAKSLPLPLSSTSKSSLLFDHKYTITAITNGSVTGIVVSTPSFTTGSAPSLPSLISMSCTLKAGDAKTAEVSISGSNVPDGEYRLILKNKVSSKETVLKIEIVDSESKLEIEIFSSSDLEYGGKYEVVSLLSSSVTVALPTDETDRKLEVPVAALVRSASCLVGGTMDKFVKVVICGENLPIGKTLSVKVKEVESTGSLIGSEIALPDATIASNTNTEQIEIEVYKATEPCLKYGKTYELTSLTITGTLPFILDESVRFSVPIEPVRVTSALCTKEDTNWTVVSVKGSGLIKDETYTLTLSGTPTDTLLLDVHDTTISVVASSPTEAKSLPLPLSSTSESSLLFGHKYTITAITNGSVTGIVEDTPSFITRSTPILKSVLCTLKVGDAKTAEVSISGSNVPDGEYRLILKNKVSSKEAVLKIEIVDSEGKVEVEIFSSSTLEYGAKYEVLSLSSNSLTVTLPTEEAYRLLTMPGVPARVRSASCSVGGEKDKFVEVVICGGNLPVGNTLTVKVKEVTSGSTTGSEIGLASTPITTTTSTEPIVIEVYDVTNPFLEYGKTYELTSLTISDTTSFILDESVRFSVPIEPVRVTSASCTIDNPDLTVVSVEGSGFMLGEFYTVSVSGHPIGSPSTPSSSLHNKSFGLIASSSKKATSSPLQLHPSEGSQLKFSYSYTIVGILYGSVEGVVHSVGFETRDDIKRDDVRVTRIEVVPASSLNTSIVLEVSGSNLPFETVGKMTLNTSFSIDVTFSSSTFGGSAVIELGVSGSLGFGSEYEITSFEDSKKKSIQTTKTIVSTPPKPSKLSLYVCGKEAGAGPEMSGADPETCTPIRPAWNTATSLGILDTTMRIVDSVDLSSHLIVTTLVPFSLTSSTMESATLRASPSSSQQSSVLVSVKEGGLCRLTLLTITADLSVSTFKLVSASTGTVVIRFCSISGTRQSESNSDDVSICGWSSGLIELIETETELNGVSMKEIEVGGIRMRGGKLKVTAGVFSQNGPSITDFPSARQNIHCEGEGVITIQSLSEGDGTKNSRSTWLDVSECRIEGDEDIASSPLFVPTLNSTESTVETDKNKIQTVKVVGKTLMPCGLSLEVFEWDSSKNVEGKSENVDLSTSTAIHWNETEIVIPFPESEVGKLNKKMELRGRLVFGNGERTSNWMIVSGLGSGNKSQGGIGSKWWIPVIICLSCALLVLLVIIVCVCLHRKRRSNQKALLSSEEMSPAQVEFDEKMEENDPITNPPNSALSSLPSINEKQDTLFDGTRFSSGEAIPPAQSYVEVIVCNESLERSVALETDTLFNALHNPHSTRFVEKRKVSQAITRGLVSLVEMNMIAEVATRLSPHWVLFDQNDRVSLKTREVQSVVGESGIVEGRKKISEEGQRWMAPEVLQESWKPTKENADHGAVFSLGLILWEIETGVVPFGEVDAATAHRRLTSDEKPRMEKVSEELQAIITPCLSLDPSQRPTLKTVLSQLDKLDRLPQPSNEKEGNAMSHVG